MIDFESLPYAKWLEEANLALVETNPDSIYFGLIKGGEVYSSYYNVGDSERALILQEMLLFSIVERTEDRIKDLVKEMYDDDQKEMSDDDQEEREDEECEDM